MKREEQIRLARQLLESGVLSEESANAIKADFPELAESEDERTRKAILNSLKEAEDSLVLTPFKKKCWIDYLERQKEQKAEEWNEEDEQYLLVCKNALNKYQRSDHWDANIISKWLEEKIKASSLRPHWKPSEEQMKALLRAVDDLQGKPYWGYINEVVCDIRDKLM